MPTEDKRLEFTATITVVSKGKKYQHWYVTIPKHLRGVISWSRGKLFKVTMEKY